MGIYAALLGVNSPQAIATPTYSSARIFRDRATVVENAASVFFCKNCDQALKGDFKAYMDEARMLSNRRNDIAHGIVIPFYDMQKPEIESFYLAPAMYRDSRFNPRAAPDYMFTSREINGFASAFLDLKARMAHLTSRLWERQPSSP